MTLVNSPADACHVSLELCTLRQKLRGSTRSTEARSARQIAAVLTCVPVDVLKLQPRLRLLVLCLNLLSCILKGLLAAEASLTISTLIGVTLQESQSMPSFAFKLQQQLMLPDCL